MTFGEKIQQLRNKHNLSQGELAKAVSKAYHVAISREDVANWETDRHVPKMEKAKALVRYFGITLDQLFFEDQKLPNKHHKRLKKAA